MTENYSTSRNQRSSKQTTRLKWTRQMISDLLECKVNAKEMVASQNPPRHENGRKKGYMTVISELWANVDIQIWHFQVNLRDQAARLEKTFGNVQETILKNAWGEERNLLNMGKKKIYYSKTKNQILKLSKAPPRMSI